MNEKKIKRLNELNDSISIIERLIISNEPNYIKRFSIDFSYLSVDLRILLVALKVEKENLEEEIKGEIKNEK